KVGVVVQDANGRAGCRGAVGDGVVMEGRVVGVKEENGPSVHVERVCGNVEVEDTTRGIRVADVDARDYVALERVFLDKDVVDRRPAYELVRVDALTEGRSGHVVVLDQVMPDDRLRTTAVGETDADDVVLDD